MACGLGGRLGLGLGPGGGDEESQFPLLVAMTGVLIPAGIPEFSPLLVLKNREHGAEKRLAMYGEREQMGTIGGG